MLNFEILQTTFDAPYLEDAGVDVLASTERSVLETEWPKARANLRRAVASLSLLFKESQVSSVTEAQMELNGAFFDLYKSSPPDTGDAHRAVAEAASKGIEAAISIAQKHCI